MMTLNRKSQLEHDEIRITPQSVVIGAEVSGVDLRQPLSADNRASLVQALLDWKVLFFRDQNITTEQHLTFARNFGDLEVHPFAPHKPDYPEVLAIGHGREAPGMENSWHSDVTWRLEPSLGSVLRCLDGPELGGDTLFCDMYAAYEGLPEAVREMIDGKYARHDFPYFRTRLRARGVSETEIEAHQRKYPNPEHPIVRSHPDTGRKAIYVNAIFTQNIIGLEKADSDKLLAYLYRQAATPEYQCRFQWQPNSIAFWDNRSCQHYAASDYWPQERRMERVTIIGDKPYYKPDDTPLQMDNSPFQGSLKYRRQGVVDQL